MEILLTVTYILLFSWLFSRMAFFRECGLSQRSLFLLFGLRILAGVCLWAIYTFYYTDRSTADIYKYFDDSQVMYDALRIHPAHYFRMLFGIGNDTPEFNRYYVQMHNWARQYESNLYNDSHTIIRFNAILRLISFGYYQVHAVILCFLSLSGLVALYKVFAPLLPGKKKAVVAAVFLAPSVLFWGSGVLKEGLIFFGMGFLILYWFRCWAGQVTAAGICWILFGSLLLLATKFYIIVSIVPGLLFMAWVLRTGTKHLLLKFGLVVVGYAGLGLAIKQFVPAYDPLQVLSIKQRDFSSLAKGGALLRSDTAMIFLTLEQRQQDLIPADTPSSYHVRKGTRLVYWHDYSADEDTLFGIQGDQTVRYTMENDMPRSGSLIAMRPLEPTVSSFLKNLPAAWRNTFFRPFPLEARSLLLLPPALEICGYTLLLLFCVFFRKKSPKGMEYALFCLSFVFILYAITGLTTPVLGAVVRYKVPGLPLLILALLFFLDQEKLIKCIPFLKRMSDK
jgi:hypothetical protein